MSNAPQNQNQPAQKNECSNQSNTGPKNSEAGKDGNNIRKDEPTAKDRMENEGGSCASSDKKSTQGGCN